MSDQRGEVEYLPMVAVDLFFVVSVVVVEVVGGRLWVQRGKLVLFDVDGWERGGGTFGTTMEWALRTIRRKGTCGFDFTRSRAFKRPFVW
jgi:hypothetical protein